MYRTRPRFRRLVGVLCGACLVLSVLHGQDNSGNGNSQWYNPVLTGAPILSITPDARSAGMADVGLTTSADAHSIFHNVSKLAYIHNEWGLSFGYTPWLTEVAKDISLSTLSGYFSWGNTGEINHAASSSFRYFHVGQALAFQQDVFVPITIVPYEFSWDLGYSIAFDKHWSLGVVVGYLKSDYNFSVDEVKGVVNNFLANLSATYQTDLRLSPELPATFRAALALNNVGDKMSYDGGRSYLFAPARLRVGVGMDMDLAEEHSLGLHLEANKVLAPTLNQADREQPELYNNMSMWEGISSSFVDASGGAAEEFKEVAWLVGAEYTYNDSFFVRGGYHYQHPSKGTNKGLTLGLGLIYEWAKLDLSYFVASESKSPLNNTFRLTLGINF